jgi:hypothetical protein
VSEYLDPVVIRVKAEVDSAIAQIRAVKAELDSLRDKRVTLTIREDAKKLNRTLADTKTAVRDVTRETDGLGRAFRSMFANIKKEAGQGHGFFGKLLGAGKGLFKDLGSVLSNVFAAAKNVGTALVDVLGVITGGIQDMEAFAQSGSQVMGALAQLAAEAVASLPALAAVAAALAALVVAATAVGAAFYGLISAGGALTAGAIGVGALVAAALPAVKNLTSGLRSLSSAQKDYSQASKNLNVGLRTSKQDMAQYQGVLKGVDSNLRGAVRLLRDSNVKWQDLSRSQRRSVVALSENKNALKSMSPAMKQALTALLAQKAAYDHLTPSQRKFAASLSSVSREWHKVQRAAQPVVTLLLNDLAKLAKDVLPQVSPLINATGNSIHRLLVRADKFVKSEKFKEWVAKVTKEIPGVIAAVGNFISKLTALIGPLITNKNNLRDLRQTLSFVYGAIKWVIDGLHRMSEVFSHVTSAGSKLNAFFSQVWGWLSKIVGAASAAARAINDVMHAGANHGWGGVIGAVGKVFGFADGTPGAPPGWAWVGERGPELVRMMGGETVLPHGPSMAMARSGYPGYAAGVGSAGAVVPNITVNVDGRQLFRIVQNRALGYNINNARRTPTGSATGVMAN